MVDQTVSFARRDYLIGIGARFAVGFAQFHVAFDEQVHHVGEFESLEVGVSDDRRACIPGVVRLLERPE